LRLATFQSRTPSLSIIKFSKAANRFPGVKINPVEPIRTGLHRIMSDFLRTQPVEEAAMLAWPLVCGAEVASRTKAVQFEDGNLTVEVSDSNWSNQLSDFAPRYLAGFSELIGPVVKRVQFKIAGSR
jgi:hypothetical protein